MKPNQAYELLAIAISERGEPTCAQTDPEAFYPNWGQSSSHETREAKQICKRCPVQPECLAYALVAKEQFGIWGGMTTEERNRLNRGTADKNRAKRLGVTL